MLALRGSLPIDDYPWPSDLEWLDAPADENHSWWNRHGGEVRLLMTPTPLGISEGLLARLPSLRHVAVFGAGLDAVAQDALAARGITLSTTGDFLHEAVGDLVFAMILASRRTIVKGDAFVRSGEWERGDFPLANDTFGYRLGIFGMGRIGQAVARRARGFAMPVGHCSARDYEGTERLGDLVALAQWADILVLACPLTPQTRGIANREIMAALGREGLLVNVARGGVVDEEALCDALEGGILGSAALDVFEGEPRINPRLLRQPNLLLTPHIGSSTRQTRIRMGDALFATVRSWLKDCQTI